MKCQRRSGSLCHLLDGAAASREVSENRIESEDASAFPFPFPLPLEPDGTVAKRPEDTESYRVSPKHTQTIILKTPN